MAYFLCISTASCVEGMNRMDPLAAQAIKVNSLRSQSTNTPTRTVVHALCPKRVIGHISRGMSRGAEEKRALLTRTCPVPELDPGGFFCSAGQSTSFLPGRRRGPRPWMGPDKPGPHWTREEEKKNAFRFYDLGKEEGENAMESHR